MRRSLSVLSLSVLCLAHVAHAASPLWSCSPLNINGDTTLLIVWGARGYQVAQSFTPSRDGVPTSIAIALTQTPYDRNTTASWLQASLFTDDGLGHPGTLLAASAPLHVTGIGYYSVTRATFPFSTAPLLLGGTSYVVVLSAPPSERQVAVRGSAVDETYHDCLGGHESSSVDGGLTWVDYVTGGYSIDAALNVNAP